MNYVYHEAKHGVLAIHFLGKDSAKRNDSIRNSGWVLAREVRVFKVLGGKDGKVLTLGDYTDNTPVDLMSKVIEEIVFNSWYGGRTVLLGDGTSVFFYVVLSKKVPQI